MLSIQSTKRGDYVVFDKDVFDNHHTHTRSLKIARIIKENVEKKILPTSRDLRMLESHLRVSTDSEYRRQILQIIDDVNKMKATKGKLIHEILQLKAENSKAIESHRISKEDGKNVDKVYRFILDMLENLYYQPSSYTVQIPYSEIIYDYYGTYIEIIINDDFTADISYVSQNDVIGTEIHVDGTSAARKLIYKLLSEAER